MDYSSPVFCSWAPSFRRSMSWRSVAKCGGHQSPWSECARSSRGVKQGHEQKLSKFVCNILCINSHWKIIFRGANAFKFNGLLYATKELSSSYSRWISVWTEWSITNLTLQYQCIVKKVTYESTQNNQPRDIILMPNQVLRTNTEEYAW